ncbi:MAG TPA: cold-shock protein, partial [Kiloniellales bacterium]|nr:cold-shock protein [Kiloniellales bacterium]
DRGGGGYDRGPRGGGGFAGGDRGGPPATSVQGTVKFFDAAKGYGFITPDDGGKDVFVSARTLGRVGLTTLENNQRVKMLVRMGQKGPMADSVELLA